MYYRQERAKRRYNQWLDDHYEDFYLECAKEKDKGFLAVAECMEKKSIEIKNKP